MIKMQLIKLRDELKSALRTPTLKQKDAYGRFSHTLSAASFVGAATVMFAETHASLYAVGRIAALIFWAVVLFVIGAILSKGE